MLAKFIRNCVVFIGVYLTLFQSSAYSEEVAGINFSDNAFVDEVFSGNFTGGYGYTSPGVDMGSWESSIIGSNIYTWMDYGDHDLLPGDDGDYNSDAPPNQYIELAFTDNDAYNGISDDLAFFQYGAANYILVALDYASIVNPYAPDSKVIRLQTVRVPGIGNNQINIGYVDLADLGVAWGAIVNNVFISSVLGENGEVYWSDPDHPAWGVPEVSAIAALYTEVPVSTVVVTSEISHEDNDVLELASGTMESNGIVLELSADTTSVAGLRFTDLNVPRGVKIEQATLEFEASDDHSEDTALTIKIEATDDASAFDANNQNDISSRSFLDEVEWSEVPSWLVNQRYHSVDISNLIQSIIDRDGWSSGQSVVLSLAGSGLRQAKAYEHDTVNRRAPVLHIKYGVQESLNQTVNKAPTVSAGDDLMTDTVYSIMLNGVVSDDALIYHQAEVSWSMESGPAGTPPSFQDENKAITEVAFSETGDYVLRLTAFDGEFSVYDELTVTVNAAESVPPSSPTDVTGEALLGGSDVTISWTKSTDNIGVVGYIIYRDDVEIGRTDLLTFTDSELDHEKLYSYQVGSYDLAGNQSILSFAQEVTTLEKLPELNIYINKESDDAEEKETGGMLLDSDLDFVDDPKGGGNQTVGLRFEGIDIPSGIKIAKATIEFTTWDVSIDAPTNLTINIEDSVDALTFEDSVHNITDRALVNIDVEWNNIAPWGTENGKYQTTDLSSLVQAVIDQDGWVRGSSIAFVISGNGLRTAKDFGASPSNSAPKLHLEFEEIGNMPPKVNAGVDFSVSQLINVDLLGDYSDDDLPVGQIATFGWTQLSGPGESTFKNASNLNTTVSFSQEGVYTLRLTVNDGELSAANDVEVSVSKAEHESPSVPSGLVVDARTGGNEMLLSWEAATDNVGVAGYVVYRNGEKIGQTEEESYLDNGLDPETLYRYQVYSYDLAGNASDKTDAIEGTTLLYTPKRTVALEVRIDQDTDDAEQKETGEMLLRSDLDFVDDPKGGGNQSIGLRFTNLDVPEGVTISKANLGFFAGEVTDEMPVNLTIQIESSDNAATFKDEWDNISNRALINMSVEWNSVEAWTDLNKKYYSADISSLVQSIVDRDGWVKGNSIVFVIKGSGLRTAKDSYYSPALAPTLNVEYSTYSPEELSVASGSGGSGSGGGGAFSLVSLFLGLFLLFFKNMTLGFYGHRQTLES